MAEANKSGILAKAQKRLSRTKTKVLQTLGKAEKSTDETFDDLVQKTEKQHDVAHHLLKEIKSYVQCMRALSTASKSLATVLNDTYEEGWSDEARCRASLEAQNLLWGDYLDNVQSTVMEPMNAYISSFPALKAKIAKRGRKMVDFDNSRHNLEVLQAAKKKDEAKIAKAQEDLNESKRIYEDLHNELCTELPDFYNSRVTFYADLFQKLFGCENILHTELARISQCLILTSQTLSKDYVQFVYTPKRPLSKSLSDNSEEHHMNGESSPRAGTDSPASSGSPAATPTTPSAVARPPDGGADAVPATSAASGGGTDEPPEDHLYSNQDTATDIAKVNGDTGDTDMAKEILQQQAVMNSSAITHGDTSGSAEGSAFGDISAVAGDSAAMNALSVGTSKDSTDSAPVVNNVYEEPLGNGAGDSGDEATYQIPPSNKPVYEAPPSTLYQVEATHTYTGEDVDELSFEPGDIIYVVPFDNEEEQDEGWQMGIKQKDGLKGVFPENFTRRL